MTALLKVIKDIATINGLTLEQEKALYRAVDKFIDDWFRAEGL